MNPQLPPLGLVAVSQRVIADNQRGERRDALDQRVVRWLGAIGALTVPIPNDRAVAAALLASLSVRGVVLTGGNDLAELGGDAPERDIVERLLLDHAERYRLPVLGICRGFQMLMARDGGSLSRVPGHAGVRHAVAPADGDNGLQRMVNSYHHYVINTLPTGWRAVATAPDRSIEAAEHAERGWLGLMWHPEREPEFEPMDLSWAHACLSGGLRAGATHVVMQVP